MNLLRTAASYLLVLHSLEQLDESNQDAIRLLARAHESQDWQLCHELLRFLHSIDDSGNALRQALTSTNIMAAKPSEQRVPLNSETHDDTQSTLDH
jgi:hypothetical protein